jgi:sorbitol-specific phosphotransferase system component IIBC
LPPAQARVAGQVLALDPDAGRGAYRTTIKSVLRFLAALMLGTAVLLPGVLILKALEVQGLAYLGMVLIAMLVGSLADRERFYGPRPPARD